MKIREWYTSTYPTDDEGVKIASSATFLGLLDCINQKSEVYDYLGAYDSIIRERCFKELAARLYVSYEVIYNTWLHGGMEV